MAIISGAETSVNLQRYNDRHNEKVRRRAFFRAVNRPLEIVKFSRVIRNKPRLVHSLQSIIRCIEKY